MNTLIKKLVMGKKPTAKEVQDELYEICDEVHSSCDCSCPVYDINKGPVDPSGPSGCACFKNGKKMYDFIKGFIVP
jgi:hypothetical protein